MKLKPTFPIPHKTLFPLLCGLLFFCHLHADNAGVISNYAGDPDGVAGNSGDGAAATLAELNFVPGVAIQPDSVLYLSDLRNNRLRKVDAAGVITHFAGDPAGSSGNTGDGGAATSALLNTPVSLVIDPTGVVYFSDMNNHRIRKIDSGVISNFAGDAISALPDNAGNTGDGGQAKIAKLNRPHAITLDSEGNLYIADSDNSRVRKVILGDVFLDGFE